MNKDFRAWLRAGALATVALLSVGCTTANWQARMETRPVIEPTAAGQAALQGRAFRVGTVRVDIDVPEPKPLHVLPDEAYAQMLKAKLEQAFAATDDRILGDKQPLTQGTQPPYIVDVTIKRMRFINWQTMGGIENGGNIELRASVHDTAGNTIASWPFRIAAGNTWGHTLDDPREAHGDLIPGAAGLITIALQGVRHGKSADWIGPMAVNVTRFHNQFGLTTMDRTETEALTSLNLDSIPLPSEAEMTAARDRDAIPLETPRPERLTAAR
ncbi:hypothetical protein [Plasticicumulans acidivorans]|uniref:Lipoprotein n=1 Tax=Plasticicumulans acidivorans TaxID=886464 RepID=A0A317MQ13_9GAMM|nr:hypothetical protein [Plasticicumulans acidivorans]PWV58322.1 hypothetical protein C7443_12013 [Plasticicumulans acidivorans]